MTFGARTLIVTVTGYLGVLTWAARAAMRAPASPTTVGQRRYAILVPAHNEARVIERAMRSAGALDHPPELVEVHVVADNCSDDTAAIVERVAAVMPFPILAHRRIDPEARGKGPALQWLLGRLDHTAFDAFVFVDADTTIEAGFLSAIDRAIDAGGVVIQGHYAVRDESANGLVAFRAAALAARTYLRPLGRTAIGGSAGLYGNGMVFTRAAIARRGWSSHLVEDIELHLDLLLDGELVVFAPDASVAAEMPDTLEATEAQHERWERGRIEITKTYLPRVLRRAVTGGQLPRRAYLDAALDQLVPPLSVVVAGTVVWGTLAAGKLPFTRGRRRHVDLATAATVSAIQCWYVWSALRLTNAPRSVYRSLLLAPRMILWKVGLWLRVFGRTDVSWERTRRNG